jgi:hypothetical protein
LQPLRQQLKLRQGSKIPVKKNIRPAVKRKKRTKKTTTEDAVYVQGVVVLALSM